MGLIENGKKSASKYYAYLEENNKGVIEYKVTNKRRVKYNEEEGYFRIDIEGPKIKDEENLIVKVAGVNCENRIKIVETGKNYLIIEAAPQIYNDIDEANICTIKVFSDMKFLVKRLEKWYEENANKIATPIKSSNIKMDLIPSDLLENATANQIEAIIAVLTLPFSFIWGAPGTGKTQFVLARLVCAYMLAGKKILICAPTNNSLEQVLYGVLPVLEEAGINIGKNVTRFGQPSSEFASKYSQVCESTKILLERKKIKREINDLENKNKELCSICEKTYKVNSILNEEGDIDYNIEECIKEIISNKEKIEELSRKLIKMKQGISEDKCLCYAMTLDTYIGKIKPEKEKPFEHVFLDEAGYSSVIKAATLLVFECPVTFLGDHKQLQPVCEMGIDEMEKNEDYMNVAYFSQSAVYIEEAVNEDISEFILDMKNHEEPLFNSLQMYQLNKSFRFGSTLADILSKYIYGGGLVGNENISTNIIIINAPVKYPFEKRNTRLNEVEKIKEYKNKHREEEIAILTPYCNQVTLLRENLNNVIDKDLIMTIHASQGREFETVILSVVDSERCFFMDSNNKKSNGLYIINTAISRAKKKLVIVCNMGIWLERDGQLITELIKNEV